MDVRITRSNHTLVLGQLHYYVLAYAGEDNYFITSNHEVLKQPKGKWLDLPVITGTADSSMLAEAGMMLQKMANIVHENSIAQLAVDSGTVELVPLYAQNKNLLSTF